MQLAFLPANSSATTRRVRTTLALAALLCLLALPSVRTAFAEDAPVTATQLRHMTAAQFQAGIDKEGAQAFIARITKESDPHNWDEPNYDIILNHIATGNAAWLRIASEIGPYALDKDFNKGMNVALAYALLENPAGVLRLRLTHQDDHFMNACMYPFPQPSDAFVKHYQKNALVSLKRVHDPALKAQTEDCRRELLSPPTEKASN
jgi:hypothetical protein